MSSPERAAILDNMGTLNIQVFLALALGGFLGIVCGWALRRWLHLQRSKALETTWHQEMTVLEERLTASSAAVRTEQNKVTQGRNLLSSTREALQQCEAMLEASRAESLALKRSIAETEAGLASRTRELSIARMDLHKARRKASELEARVASLDDRIAQLEPLFPRLLHAELQLAGQTNAEEPVAFPGPGAEPADDLKEIYGIGPVCEEKLNGIGIYRFSQIASWTAEDVERFKGLLPEFKDRIVWDNWVEGARLQHEKKYGHSEERMAS